MRDKLVDLINKTIIYKYELPNQTVQINKTKYSTINDKCYLSNDNNSLSEIIYNSIVEYSFNDFDINGKDYAKLHLQALKVKLKYNELANETTKISYGFHGETILYCMLLTKLFAKPIISRGYFYSPLESSETKGYDSYHLIEDNGSIELWFGEVKFRTTHSSGIDSAMENIEKAISDEYMSKNFMALINHKNNFNISGSSVEKIILEWEENPIVDIIDEIKKYNIKLVYPIVIIYNESNSGYENSIIKAVEYLNNKNDLKKFSLSIPYSINFIFMPVGDVRNIKAQVIQWIESKKPLI